MSGFDRDFGTYAEQLVVPASDLAVVPEALDLVTASTVPLNGLAAAQIVDLLGDAPADGNRLLVTGAAGAVGGYVASLAQDRGWRVTGLARAEDETFVRSLSADFTTQAERDGMPSPTERCCRSGASPSSARAGPSSASCRAPCRPRSARLPSSWWWHTPTDLDWPICSPAPIPASCRLVYTRSSQWTKLPTPIAPWRRAGCADTCSEP